MYASLHSRHLRINVFCGESPVTHHLVCVTNQKFRRTFLFSTVRKGCLYPKKSLICVLKASHAFLVALSRSFATLFIPAYLMASQTSDHLTSLPTSCFSMNSASAICLPTRGHLTPLAINTEFLLSSLSGCFVRSTRFFLT